MIRIQRLTFVTGLVALTALASSALPACYVGTEPPGATVVTSAEVSDDYDPAYYDGYVVYYDDGRPYYYDRGAVVWVSPSSPHYVGLVNHWHVYGRGYGRWYAHDGYRYRSYRGAPGYHAYHGNTGHARGRR
jgi:hypothetical protein